MNHFDDTIWNTEQHRAHAIPIVVPDRVTGDSRESRVEECELPVATKRYTEGGMQDVISRSFDEVSAPRTKKLLVELKLSYDD